MADPVADQALGTCCGIWLAILLLPVLTLGGVLLLLALAQ